MRKTTFDGEDATQLVDVYRKSARVLAEATNCRNYLEFAMGEMNAEGNRIELSQMHLNYWFKALKQWKTEKEADVCKVPELDLEENSFAASFCNLMLTPDVPHAKINAKTPRGGSVILKPDGKAPGTRFCHQLTNHFDFCFLSLFVPLGWDEKALKNGHYLLWLVGSPKVNRQTTVAGLMGDGHGTLDVTVKGGTGTEDATALKLLTEEEIHGSLYSVDKALDDSDGNEATAAQDGNEATAAQEEVPVESMVQPIGDDGVSGTLHSDKPPRASTSKEFTNAFETLTNKKFMDVRTEAVRGKDKASKCLLCLDAIQEALISFDLRELDNFMKFYKVLHSKCGFPQVTQDNKKYWVPHSPDEAFFRARIMFQSLVRLRLAIQNGSRRISACQHGLTLTVPSGRPLESMNLPLHGDPTGAYFKKHRKPSDADAVEEHIVQRVLRRSTAPLIATIRFPTSPGRWSKKVCQKLLAQSNMGKAAIEFANREDIPGLLKAILGKVMEHDKEWWHLAKSKLENRMDAKNVSHHYKQQVWNMLKACLSQGKACKSRVAMQAKMELEECIRKVAKESPNKNKNKKGKGKEDEDKSKKGKGKSPKDSDTDKKQEETDQARMNEMAKFRREHDGCVTMHSWMAVDSCKGTEASNVKKMQVDEILADDSAICFVLCRGCHFLPLLGSKGLSGSPRPPETLLLLAGLALTYYDQNTLQSTINLVKNNGQGINKNDDQFCSNDNIVNLPIKQDQNMMLKPWLGVNDEKHLQGTVDFLNKCFGAIPHKVMQNLLDGLYTQLHDKKKEVLHRAVVGLNASTTVVLLKKHGHFVPVNKIVNQHSSKLFQYVTEKFSQLRDCKVDTLGIVTNVPVLLFLVCFLVSKKEIVIEFEKSEVSEFLNLLSQKKTDKNKIANAEKQDWKHFVPSFRCTGESNTELLLDFLERFLAIDGKEPSHDMVQLWKAADEHLPPDPKTFQEEFVNKLNPRKQPEKKTDTIACFLTKANVKHIGDEGHINEENYEESMEKLRATSISYFAKGANLAAASSAIEHAKKGHSGSEEFQVNLLELCGKTKKGEEEEEDEEDEEAVKERKAGIGEFGVGMEDTEPRRQKCRLGTMEDHCSTLGLGSWESHKRHNQQFLENDVPPEQSKKGSRTVVKLVWGEDRTSKLQGCMGVVADGKHNDEEKFSLETADIVCPSEIPQDTKELMDQLREEQERNQRTARQLQMANSMSPAASVQSMDHDDQRDEIKLLKKTVKAQENALDFNRDKTKELQNKLKSFMKELHNSSATIAALRRKFPLSKPSKSHACKEIIEAEEKTSNEESDVEMETTSVALGETDSPDKEKNESDEVSIKRQLFGTSEKDESMPESEDKVPSAPNSKGKKSMTPRKVFKQVMYENEVCNNETKKNVVENTLKGVHAAFQSWESSGFVYKNSEGQKLLVEELHLKHREDNQLFKPGKLSQRETAFKKLKECCAKELLVSLEDLPKAEKERMLNEAKEIAKKPAGRTPKGTPRKKRKAPDGSDSSPRNTPDQSPGKRPKPAVAVSEDEEESKASLNLMESFKTALKNSSFAGELEKALENKICPQELVPIVEPLLDAGFTVPSMRCLMFVAVMGHCTSVKPSGFDLNNKEGRKAFVTKVFDDAGGHLKEMFQEFVKAWPPRKEVNFLEDIPLPVPLTVDTLLFFMGDSDEFDSVVQKKGKTIKGRLKFAEVMKELRGTIRKHSWDLPTQKLLLEVRCPEEKHKHGLEGLLQLHARCIGSVICAKRSKATKPDCPVCMDDIRCLKSCQESAHGEQVEANDAAETADVGEQAVWNKIMLHTRAPRFPSDMIVHVPKTKQVLKMVAEAFDEGFKWEPKPSPEPESMISPELKPLPGRELLSSLATPNPSKKPRDEEKTKSKNAKPPPTASTASTASTKRTTPSQRKTPPSNGATIMGDLFGSRGFSPGGAFGSGHRGLSRMPRKFGTSRKKSTRDGNQSDSTASSEDYKRKISAVKGSLSSSKKRPNHSTPSSTDQRRRRNKKKRTVPHSPLREGRERQAAADGGESSALL